MNAADTHELEDTLDRARVQQDLTWNDVARLAGISPQALRKIRSGEVTPRKTTLRALEDALGMESGTLRTFWATPSVRAAGGSLSDIAADFRSRLPGDVPDTLVTVRNGTRARYLLVEIRAGNISAEATARLGQLLQGVADFFCDGLPPLPPEKLHDSAGDDKVNED